jgi:YD repeat-containing protein
LLSFFKENLFTTKILLKQLSLFLKITLIVFTSFLLAENEQQAVSAWHQYDPIQQTETWQLTKEKKVIWSYDSFGNRTASKDWTGTTYYTYDRDGNLATSCTPSKDKTLYL